MSDPKSTSPSAPSPYDTYSSPLASRNASKQMLELWSPRHKFNTWRRIWLAVAEAQCEMTNPPLGDKGAPSASSGSGPTTKPLVTREQVEELRAVVQRPGGITDDEIRAAERYERELRHDVMAHVHALGDSCPKAKGIIHLGMTSQDVVCNADLRTLDNAVWLLSCKTMRVIDDLAQFSERYKAVPALGFTHYQPAQPVTVGRRAALWAHDISLCDKRLKGLGWTIGLRGLRGATGTQAASMSLAGNRTDVVDRMEYSAVMRIFADDANTYGPCMPDNEGDVDSVGRLYMITGQTYPRVIDTFILADLASTASVLHKIATDIRLLCNRKEIDEPFEDKQIGSSAMPYKRNPMRCERICGLTRFVMNLVGNAYDTAATQWLERTLDDSSNRRLSLPEAFLALDGALDLMHNVASGLIVHEAMVRKNLMAELPFMATENILMACVKLGADRQEYHEVIRQHAQAAGMRVKSEGLDNDLLDRLKADPHFQSAARGGKLSAELDWHGVMDPMKYIGRSVEQTERFLKEVIVPLREQYGERIAAMDESGPRV
ncbi:MAG: adenylosuccinate lyase [Phycisphaerales bacterium]|nr:adenylosuccinate lyase [Phycisphaerales bacterium]